jgi:hypothetical protein
VDWGSLVGTGLGAVIGVSATLGADRINWRRSRQDSDKTARHQVYADYLAALTRARNGLRSAARHPNTPAAERARQAEETFHDGVYELRYRVALLAPEPVVEASVIAFRALRDLRDLVEAGSVRSDEDYLRQRDVWEDALHELQRAMRADLAG